MHIMLQSRTTSIACDVYAALTINWCIFSMYKSEVQALATLLSSSSKIVHLLFGCKGVPFAVPLLISPNIVDLVERIDKDIENTDPY